MSDDTSTRHSDWVTNRNSATIWIHFFWINIQKTLICNGNNRKGFVNFPLVNLRNIFKKISKNKKMQKLKKKFKLTSSLETPAHSRAFGTASAGAIGKSIGSVAASANPRTRASGVQPSAAAFSALIKIIAQAPSFNVDALPAVTVPSFLKTARRLPNFDSLKRVYSSSLVTTVSGYNKNVKIGRSASR